MERPTMGVRVHPGVKQLLESKADDLRQSTGWLIETMAKDKFGPSMPADFAPGENVPDDWRKRWGLPDAQPDNQQGERH